MKHRQMPAYTKDDETSRQTILYIHRSTHVVVTVFDKHDHWHIVQRQHLSVQRTQGVAVVAGRESKGKVISTGHRAGESPRQLKG